MPQKSVREMSGLERTRYSLRARTFHAVQLLCLILSLAAIVFGIALYYTESARRTRDRASDTARMAAELVDGDAVAGCARRVLAGESGEALRDADYESVARALRLVKESNGITSIFIGMPDEAVENFTFYVNPDEGGTAYRPGNTIALDAAHARTYTGEEGITSGVILRMNDGSYACSAGAPVYDSAGALAGYVICNTDLTDVIRTAWRFLWQYALLLAVVATALAVIFVQRMKKNVVSPINRLATAAESYIEGKKKGGDADSFASLDIHTGDEIENLALIMADMEQEMAEYEEDLASTTAEKERIGTELNIASQIQEGMIPNIYPAFPDRPEFDVYATMHTAKEVGGDFYDFFLIDDDHLAIVMADVSGKGVPAAMFMMASKILISNYAAVDGASPARILEKVNHSICLNNKAEMFVTVWLGILELSTGKLRAANAGHEYPAVQTAGEGFRLYKDKHGFVVGGMDGMRYRDYTLELSPGDGLFLYTDGVTEATSEAGELFGTERLLAALNAAAEGSPEDVLSSVKAGIDGFVGAASQFDDITMLCLRYAGKGIKKLTVRAEVENLDTVMSFVDAQLEAADCPAKVQMQINVAVEELFVNIANYAYAPGTGNAVIGVRMEEEPRRAVITFSDSGIPYNPLARKDPDVTLSAEEREIGGLGVFMVKKTMDELHYEYRDGQNVLTICKNLQESDQLKKGEGKC